MNPPEKGGMEETNEAEGLIVNCQKKTNQQSAASYRTLSSVRLLELLG